MLKVDVDGVAPLQHMMKDPYANYVVQKVACHLVLDNIDRFGYLFRTTGDRCG